MLLNNPGNALPVKDLRSIGVFGQDAAKLGTGPQPILNFGDYQGETFDSHLGSGGSSGTGPVGYLVSPLDALTRRVSGAEIFDYRFILSDNHTVLPPPSTAASLLPVDWGLCAELCGAVRAMSGLHQCFRQGSCWLAVVEGCCS